MTIDNGGVSGYQKRIGTLERRSTCLEGQIRDYRSFSYGFRKAAFWRLQNGLLYQPVSVQSRDREHPATIPLSPFHVIYSFEKINYL
jgi:hypothetical protein